MTAPTSSTKWVLLAVKALIAAATLLPQLQRKSGKGYRGEADESFKDIKGEYGLVFLTSTGNTIATVKLDYTVANCFYVDTHKIKSLAAYHQAYAAAVHCKEVGNDANEPFTRQQVVNRIAQALRDAGVNVLPDVNAT